MVIFRSVGVRVALGLRVPSREASQRRAGLESALDWRAQLRGAPCDDGCCSGLEVCVLQVQSEPCLTRKPTEMNDDDLPTIAPACQVQPGLYRHYKGGEYEVMEVARHSETLEPMVVYRALYGQRGLWVRPAAMFAEDVVIDGVVQPRFARHQSTH